MNVSHHNRRYCCYYWMFMFLQCYRHTLLTLLLRAGNCFQEETRIPCLKLDKRQDYVFTNVSSCLWGQQDILTTYRRWKHLLIRATCMYMYCTAPGGSDTESAAGCRAGPRTPTPALITHINEQSPSTREANVKQPLNSSSPCYHDSLLTCVVRLESELNPHTCRLFSVINTS